MLAMTNDSRCGGDYRGELPHASALRTRPPLIRPRVFVLPISLSSEEGSAFPPKTNVRRLAAFSLYLIFLFTLPKVVVMRVSVEDCFRGLLVAIALLAASVSVLGVYLAYRRNPGSFLVGRKVLGFLESPFALDIIEAGIQSEIIVQGD